MTTTQSTPILRFAEVLALTGFKSRTTIWRKLKSGDFPDPIDLGGDQIGWLQSDIEEWIASRPRRTYR